MLALVENMEVISLLRGTRSKETQIGLPGPVITIDKREIFALQHMVMVSHPLRDETGSMEGLEEERVAEGGGGS